MRMPMPAPARIWNPIDDALGVSAVMVLNRPIATIMIAHANQHCFRYRPVFSVKKPAIVANPTMEYANARTSTPDAVADTSLHA